jgi:hypothetical protein
VTAMPWSGMKNSGIGFAVVAAQAERSAYRSVSWYETGMIHNYQRPWRRISHSWSRR